MVTHLRLMNEEAQQNVPILPAFRSCVNMRCGTNIMIGERVFTASDIYYSPPFVIERKGQPIVIVRPFDRVSIIPADTCEWVVISSDTPESYIHMDMIFLGSPAHFQRPGDGVPLLEGTSSRECLAHFEYSVS